MLAHNRTALGMEGKGNRKVQLASGLWVVTEKNYHTVEFALRFVLAYKLFILWICNSTHFCFKVVVEFALRFVLGENCTFFKKCATSFGFRYELHFSHKTSKGQLNSKQDTLFLGNARNHFVIWVALLSKIVQLATLFQTSYTCLNKCTIPTNSRYEMHFY
jgi:hypothetical protein